ncbi:MAG: alpha-2-macroglobulin family protein [Robiginitomaculum sp.]|nr:alpha-2-macroglobulin family protein [Robiginitomaculum sp.]
MKRQSLLIIGGISLFILAWWVGYALLGDLDFRKKTVETAPPVTVMQAAQEAAGVQDVVGAQDAADAQGARSSRKTRKKEPTDNAPFLNTGWKIDEAKTTPRACLQFSMPMNRADNLKIADYIRVEPETKVTTEITGKRLCLSGLEFSKDYTVTMLAGLPSAGDKVLVEDKSLEISFGNRPAHIAFAGNGVILPRIGAQGLAIETTNIKELEIEVFRVGDRMIARRRPDTGQTIPEGDYYYAYDNVATEVREQIWKGAIIIDSSPNTVTTTVFDLAGTIGELKPGAYIVEAVRKRVDDEDYRPARAWRWIISTDLAFTTYQSPSGLDATVRSINTAKPMRNIRVDLVARNNEILDRAETDKDGRVHFDAQLLKGKGSSRPRMLMAYGKEGDYALLDFNRSPLDLSAFAIGGRSAAKDIDAYVFTDRGVYRPGETANITAMLRTVKAQAITGRVGQVRYIKPNGQEFRKVRFNNLSEGTLLQAFDIPKSAPRGIWRAVVEVDGMGQVGAIGFDVQDFVPQKLKVDVKIDDAPLRVDEIRPLEISAQFLYGANGADLAGEAEARIRVDPNPFPDLKGYKFGLDEVPFREEFINLGGGTTDAKGLLMLDMSMKGADISTMKPLRAEITAGVSEPGGRYVQTSTRIAVRTQDKYIGIKSDFTRRPERNKSAGFNIKAVDWQGKSTLMEIEWTLVKEERHYNWYRKNGRWRYRYDSNDVEIATGIVKAPASEGAQVARTLDWGRYRLIAKQSGGDIRASYRFYVGWGGSTTGSNAPDQIEMGTPELDVNSGETVKLTINSPYAGLGELVIADQAVRSIQTVNIPKGGSEITVRMPKDIGSGVYALLSVYTPRSADKRPVPRRAVGIAYMKANVEQQKLGVSLSAPDVVKPRQTQKIRVDFDNVPRGEKVYLTLAAVDEGVLQITKYKSPNPEKFFFGRKSLPLTVRDDYARLLNPNLGAPSLARSGGDTLGGEGLTAAPIKVVSLYSGLVDVKGGKVTVPVELPDFNGKLRLMAVAWSRTAVGSDVQPIIVRDAVPAILSLPRFLAPGDKALATISVDNVGGAAGNYGLSLTGNGVLSIENIRDKLKLNKGQRKSVTREILTNQTGISTVNLAVTGPRGYAVNSSFDIQTRSAFMPITKMVTAPMKAGEVFRLDTDMLQGFDPGSVDVNVSFSRTPGVDPTAYATAVSRYPYGCSEQTVSAAMPLLYAHELGGVPGINAAEAKFALQVAVDKLLNRQSSDGSFGLWRSGDRYARPWLGVYVTDFLLRAKDKDYVVSDKALNKSLNALYSITKMPRYPSLNYLYSYEVDNVKRRLSRQAEAAAYAHYVLAKNGKGKLKDMRYFSDNHAKKLRSAMSWGHLATALSMMGDERRADQAFKKALSLVDAEIDHDYYQSPTRDASGLLAMIKEAGQDKYLEEAQAAFQKHLKEPNRLNTQAQAQVILAIRSFLKDSEPVNITAKNAKIDVNGGVAKSHLYNSDVVNKPVFTNATDKQVWRSVMISGTPLKAPLAVNEGYDVTKRIQRIDGTLADLNDIKQGERYIVKISFNSTTARSGLAVIADLLPAGMEIEAILEPGETAYENVGKLSRFQTSEMRDDRLVAATRTYKKRTYRIAYLVRAVTPGDFVWPGVVVQDMYRAQDHAISKATRVRISAQGKG